MGTSTGHSTKVALCHFSLNDNSCQSQVPEKESSNKKPARPFAFAKLTPS
jgi:hypothetical protein